jgi:hypothetical protein
MWGFIIPLLVGLALNIVAYLIMPKPKKPKPAAAKDMDNPTVDAGRPIPVLFGTVTIKGLNILWYGDKKTYEYQARVPTQSG